MLSVVILTAGQGTRMKSGLPKGLHEVAGVPMLGHVIARAQELKVSSESEEIVIVTGHGADQIEGYFSDAGVTFARQDRQLGTAHAFLCAASALEGREGDIVVLYGDTPLVRRETLEAALSAHRASGAGMTVITGVLEDATGYGRIVHDEHGDVVRIVEQKSATPEELLIREWNSGMYIFDSSAFSLARRIGHTNPAGEYYLTDILELYRAEGKHVQSFVGDSDELHGVNDRVQLAAAERVMRDRVRENLMRGGVTMRDPATTYVDAGVQIEADVILEPGVTICGSCFIGTGSVIGAYSILRDVRLEASVHVKPHSVLEGATVGAGCDVGPFARLRPGTVLKDGVHVGNFVEIKNSTLLEGAKAGHLAYIGDASVGREVNFSAGAITANYDGVHKHRTVIEDGAFVGTNATLVAPVHLHEGAFVAAGSTITTDLPEGALGVTRATQKTIEDWSQRYWTRKLENVKPGKLPVIQRWLERRKQGQ
jgi:bifunctional UDP-N-acetylglucosamine pyrophosphorylase / glucosamine-1-phosphate N-acetyltransferase